MKTITLQGTAEQISNLSQIQSKFDEGRLPILVETRVYVLESDLQNSQNKLKDEQFMDVAESIGRVYTLQGFQEAFNLEEVNSSIDVIRIIIVPLH